MIYPKVKPFIVSAFKVNEIDPTGAVILLMQGFYMDILKKKVYMIVEF